MYIEFLIFSRGNVYNISNLCEGKITLSTFKTGRASELSFTVLRDICSERSFKFFEGDKVTLKVNSYNLFCGYIFKKISSKGHFVSVTAYDQLRYLKAKDTYSFSYVTASDIVKKIADDFSLNTGAIQNSEYVIASRIEENQSLFDIILNAVDITRKATAREFVLFDDFGKLTFKETSDMCLPFAVLDEDKSVIDFTVVTDIDSDTYNRVKLLRSDQRQGFFSTVVKENSESMKKIGVLQYFQKIPYDMNDAQTVCMAEAILKEKDRISKSLHVSSYCSQENEALIRAGSRIFVNLSDVGEDSINSYITVQKCVHTFQNNKHIVDVYF